MANWIITSSALIIVILFIRKCFGSKLMPGVQYGLWLLVLLRLLVPGSFIYSSYSPAELAGRAGAALREVFAPEVETYIVQGYESITEADDGKMNPESYNKVEDHYYYPVESPGIEQSPRSGGDNLLYVIWLIGMGVVGGIFLMLNLFLRIRIYSDREEIDEEELERRGLRSEVPVYVTGFVETPCIAGLKTAAVYLPVSLWEESSEEGQDGERKHRELDAMICHENIHYRHGDQFWGFLRLLCLILHWYNPLVWVAALASRHDAELFCDAAVVKKIGEKNRFEYGRLLVRITAQERQNMERLFGMLGYAGLCNTEMTGSKNHIERRIKKLAKMPEKNALPALFVCLAALAAFGWLFTGGGKDKGFSVRITGESDVFEEEYDIKITPNETIQNNLSEDFFPGEEETEEVRNRALRGMSEEEIDALTVYVKDYHNWLEYRLLYENWESRLLDQESVVWNFIDESGTVQAGWVLEDDPADYLEMGEEGRKELMQKYPEFGQIPLEELRKKYGEPFYEESRYGAERVIERMRELTASAENEVFKEDVEALCGALGQAKDTHEAVYVTQAHEILHDMEYFLLRYSPRDVAPYTTDKTLSGRFYGALRVWRAWQEGTL